MCGRYTLKSRADVIARTFGVEAPPTLPERFNIAPSQLVLAIHERMPVVIPPESFDVWLDPCEHNVDKLSRRLRPFHPDEMTAYPVSTLVNNVRQDSAKCVEPLEVA